MPIHFRSRCVRFVPLLVAALACESQSPAPPPTTDLNHFYWNLQLNHQAVLLSTTPPYDTLTLVATPENLRNEPLTGFPAPEYGSTNVDLVRVSPDGVLQAVAPAGQVAVIARLTAGNVTLEDTVFVDVVENPTPPVLTTFSAHPVPPDSAKLGANSVIVTLPLQALDADGLPLTVPVYFRSSDPTIAQLDPHTGAIVALRPGPVTFYASTVAFGVVKADTVPFRIGMPIFAPIAIQRQEATTLGGSAVNVFVPSEVVAGPGAAVKWETALGVATDITFSDPTLAVVPATPPGTFAWLLCTLLGFECGSGNIAPLVAPPDGVAGAIRGFTAPGIYEYHSTLHGTSGRIVIVDESGL